MNGKIKPNKKSTRRRVVYGLFFYIGVPWFLRYTVGAIPYCFLNTLLKYETSLMPIISDISIMLYVVDTSKEQAYTDLSDEYLLREGEKLNNW